MKNYSDLTDIDTRLNLRIEIIPIGLPNIHIIVNQDSTNYPRLLSPMIVNYQLDLLKSIDIGIVLYDKHYTTEYETAVMLKIYIDNNEIIPKYLYLARYVNDHNDNNPTDYLGFNGKWTLTIDRPFYQWLHTHSGQGWLIG